MDTIILDNVLPRVFAGIAEPRPSEVWSRRVELHRGHTYLIEAASGTGKSSLCSFIVGLRRDYEGRILFDSTDISTFKPSHWAALRRTSISILPQELRLFPELTAWENVCIKNQLTGCQSQQRIGEWFERLGIADRRDTLVARMSWGQQQRVALVRALCQPFDVLLADEPISHLDDDNASIMAGLLTEEARRQGATLVITSIGKHMSLPYDQILHL